MGLRINPAPASFKSPAVKNIESTNTGGSLKEENILSAADSVHTHFKAKGYYDAIKDSDRYSRGNPSNGDK